MVLRQARTMREAAIIELFEYIGHRQELYGAEKAFRFRSFKHKTKGILPARYPHAADANESDARGDVPPQGPAKRLRRRARSKKANRVVGTDNEADREAGDQGNHSDVVANHQSHSPAATGPRGQIQRSRATRVVGIDDEAEGGQGGQGDHPVTADDNQSHSPMAKEPRGRTRSQKASRVMGTDDDAEGDGGGQGDHPDAAHHEQQNNLPARHLVGPETPATGPDGLSQPDVMDPLVLPTPSPSPGPNQPAGTARPKPRPKVNPNSRRIQPNRKGKVN